MGSILPITYRKAQISDLNELAKIEREIFELDAYSRDTLSYLIKHADCFVVAEHNGKIVGYVCANVVGKQGHIMSICTLEEYRNKGIGSTLLNLAIESLRKKNVSKIYLEVSVKNTNAINFYTKRGFRIVGTIPKYYADGSDAYLMSLDLNPSI
ncbi:MAG: ribosomal protein S18-alanine N-acetyltransferase [Candidatus Geothermarchaeota archaeon]